MVKLRRRKAKTWASCPECGMLVRPGQPVARRGAGGLWAHLECLLR